MYRRFGKRCIDLLLSGIGLIVLSPFFFILFFLILVADRQFPLYFQIRPGWKAKPFKIVKFRTMRLLVDSYGQLLPDEQRTTRVGHWLRQSSIDELPQLWNVFIGEMSIVGPRPLLMEYLPHYSMREQQRHAIKPGLTGWAQIHGRTTLSLQEKITYDLEYLDRCSLRLDVYIVWRTLFKK